MTGYLPALAVEWLKVRRSRVPLFTMLGITLLPIMGGFFMFILKDQARARRLGLLGTKAQLAGGNADWPSFLDLLAQGVAVGGLLLFAVVAAWVFGREFSDRTARGLLALPTPRRSIVAAKLTVVALWCALLAGWVLVLGFPIGELVSLPGFSVAVAAAGVLRLALVTAMVVALQSTTVVVASAGRGFLAPLGWAMLTLFLAQVVAAAGFGAYFPWSVPVLASGLLGAQGSTLRPMSFLIVGATVAGGLAGVFAWWEYADQPA